MNFSEKIPNLQTFFFFFALCFWGVFQKWRKTALYKLLPHGLCTLDLIWICTGLLFFCIPTDCLQHR